mmetsp:Transcript_6695/g.18743  ORF Transcript_6695/g.18743 Transcript_6695/m.18743 type:complete len:85 (-) Transcript_6695:1441-1695(-)
MARFAKDIVVSMSMLVQQLEVTLGPDTTDLGIRVGIHSGPVTAGKGKDVDILNCAEAPPHCSSPSFSKVSFVDNVPGSSSLGTR